MYTLIYNVYKWILKILHVYTNYQSIAKYFQEKVNTFQIILSNKYHKKVSKFTHVKLKKYMFRSIRVTAFKKKLNV